MKCPLNNLCECDKDCAWSAVRYRKDGVTEYQCAVVCGIEERTYGDWNGNHECVDEGEKCK